MLASNPVTARFYGLGLWLYRFRLPVIATWVALLLVGLWGASKAPQVLKGGGGTIHGSSSERASHLLDTEFQNPYRFSFLVTVSSERAVLGEAALDSTLRDAQKAVAGLPFVTRTVSYLDHARPALRSPDGHRTFFVVGLTAKSDLDAEQLVVPTRTALLPVIARHRLDDPGLKIFVTGETPISYDGTQVLVDDTATAEKRIFPLALVLLLLAFGALAAAGIPVMVGALASVITLGLLVIVGHFMNLSAMAQNISSMVGLGVGIDYSLIIVSRFREARARGPHVGVEEAVAECVATSGQAVVYSGLTVVIGFLALFLPGVIDTTSIAVAGSLTVLVSVALAVTLLPAVLGVLGRWLDWPFGFSRFIGRFKVERWWYAWAHMVMAHPYRCLVGGTLVLLLLAAPVMGVKFGQFSSKFIPLGMPSGSGLLELEKMGQAGQLYPIAMVVKFDDGQKVFSPKALSAFAGVVQGLRAAPEVADVHSIVENASTLILLNNLFFHGDVAALRGRFPEAASMLVSQDGAGTVIQIVPRSDASYSAIKDFTRQLQRRDWRAVPGLAHAEVAFSGEAPTNNDFEAAILGALPKVVALVFGITFVLLYLSFRSVILPLKALVMNTLSVAASFGALVMVFQNGFGCQLIGVSEGLGVMLVPVPIIVFCAVFGLSMDYEVFLLSRIKEEYDATGDNTHSVAAGLAATGGIITNAALIMLLVFGAFMFANVILTKMLGFGLAVAVLVDALVIRLMLVPSFMAVVGRWNWWPHVREPVARPATERDSVGAPH